MFVNTRMDTFRLVYSAELFIYIEIKSIHSADVIGSADHQLADEFPRFPHNLSARIAVERVHRQFSGKLEN